MRMTRSTSATAPSSSVNGLGRRAHQYEFLQRERSSAEACAIMGDRIRDIAHACNELLDLLQHAVDVRASVLSSSSLTFVGSRCFSPMDDGSDGLPNAVHPRHERASRDQAIIRPAIDSTAMAAVNPYQKRRSRGANSLLSRPMSR